MLRDDGSTAHHEAFWELFVAGALRYPWVWVTGRGEATAVWIPPGGTEMSPEQESRLATLVREQLGPSAELYFELLARFEAAHPRDEPHYYLSLLGTHPEHRGRGIGVWLLEQNLSPIDAEHRAAYLESSNPVNDKRYQALGFRPVGEFGFPGGGPIVTTMWRDAR